MTTSFSAGICRENPQAPYQVYATVMMHGKQFSQVEDVTHDLNDCIGKLHLFALRYKPHLTAEEANEICQAASEANHLNFKAGN